MTDCWINGEPGHHLDVNDRAARYGDGLFETIRVREGRAEYLPLHMARLREGSTRLRLRAVPWQTLEREINTAAQQCANAILKVALGRGGSERGYRFSPDAGINRVVQLFPPPGLPADAAGSGVRVRLCDTRLAIQPALAGIKHMNRLEQVLARAEWDDPGISEGLMLNQREELIEGTMSNLFLVSDGALLTAELSECGVAGVMRSVIIDLARQNGVETTIGSVTLNGALAAQELFVCNSLIGIWPVRAIDQHRDYSVGPLTRSIMTALDSTPDSMMSNWYAS
jgi:4-amino-4-deoxychorismate lyase